MRIDKGRKNIMISALREENQMYDGSSDKSPAINISEGAAKKEGGRNSSLSKSSDAKALSNAKYLVKLVLFENKRFDKSSQVQAGAAAPTDRSQGGTQGQL